MNMYTHDFSLFDFADIPDPIIDPISLFRHHRQSSSFSSSESSISSNRDNAENGAYFNRSRDDGKSVTPKPKSPPRHRHDGMSPLPLGMDWSLPPRKWDGRDTVWPHDPHSGWSYCVTIPSWTLLSTSGSSVPVTFYRVQVGIQSPEGITTTRGILRRYSDFLKLHSELKNAFPYKALPPPPPKRIFRRKNKMLLEERRCSLEDWMEKLLSDIDVSRSASVGTFLELEAAARSSFDDASSSSDMIPPALIHTRSDVSLMAGSVSIASDIGNDSIEVSELETPSYTRGYNADSGMETSTSELNSSDPADATVKYGLFNRKSVLKNLEKLSRRKIHIGGNEKLTLEDGSVENAYKGKSYPGDGNEALPGFEYQRLDGRVQRLSMESVGSGLSSPKAGEISNLGFCDLFGDDSIDAQVAADNPELLDAPTASKLRFPRDSRVVLPLDERQKLNRVLSTARQRLATAKTDMKDLIARLNQEIAVRQFLTTKVKDMEVDLETTRNNCKENMLQAALVERERFTQMQWDVEELRRKCLEVETKLKSEEEERTQVESAKNLVVEEKEMLQQQLDAAREDFDNLLKHHEEFELKSKADVKLLVKEVKSLRSSESDLKLELSRLLKEKIEVERALQKEKQRIQAVTTANTKLFRECEILQNRLRECSVDFQVEEEDKLIMDKSSPSDAVDLLATSDNRIGLLLAEAQLLAQDVEKSLASADESRDINGSNRTDDKLQKLLTEVFIDNARLRMQVNSVIRCALKTQTKSDSEDEEEETPLRKTVLSKFLER